ncbi:single-stranded DNA-binding protein [Nocardiopsis eucommiae]|uniref:Single-stranded DNA-binding protein n=1 Tax=Nocardiopsis eucommiae TaxID=2831970 RepID=A0A975LBM5_9ACTN|nr:single-stranded DNA-binding protein [Nocardiopsis eucommiae]
MALPSITVTARLVDAPEIRYSQSGTAIAKLRLVSNSRKLNRDTQQWEDADVWWGRGTAFARTAEAIAEANLQKGDLVTVRGEVKTDQWEDQQPGAKRSADEVIVRDIGRALTPPRQSGGYAANGSFGQQGSAPSGDPWGQGGRPGFGDDQPPF